MLNNYALDRSSTEEFARRVRKNLEFIIAGRADGKDVHEVTQLVISLLGLVVFPWEAKAIKALEGKGLAELEASGWPRWNILLDKPGHTYTLGKLTWHLRNAIAHQRITFSSDEPEMENVVITFTDAPTNKPVNWRAEINAADLRVFCERFTEQLEESVG